jgi:long-chain acyl-CoA synthetase
MQKETLLDFFSGMSDLRGEFLVYDNGYRSFNYGYADVVRASVTFAHRLQQVEVGKGDHVALWSENRPEWIIAFWGCLLRGAVVVPIDAHSSVESVQRIIGVVKAKLLLVGEEVTPPTSDNGPVPVWRLVDSDRGRGEVLPGQELERERLSSITTSSSDDLVELVFTSGATSEPKGVKITHRNLLANMVPIEEEIKKYRKYGRPFFPIRFLNLLPLSHMFGQAMATLIPPMLSGTVVFMRGFNPAEIVHQIKSRRISVVVGVPKILDILREHITRVDPNVLGQTGQQPSVVMRWWRYRQVHRAFGMKFWCFVVGGAPLDPELEAFWSRIGFLVVQGYGLTETAPIVSLNHPFNAQKGSVGKALPGIEVRIATDGEILVKGNNVTSGYFKAGGEEDAAFENGWLHTGDVGAVDDQGRIQIRGRKKEMIVTPDGLNVFPEDVERALNALPDVSESAVVGVHAGAEERVHAVVVLEPGHPAATQERLAEIVRRANEKLEDHQRIRGISVWPHDQLPRTEGTQKLRRFVIREWVETGAPLGPEPGSGSPLEAILQKYLGGRPLTPDLSIDEIGLTSLDRVELLLELEQRFQTGIEETTLSQARSIKDLQSLIEHPPSSPIVEQQVFPTWSCHWTSQVVRRTGQEALILPLTRLFAWMTVVGREHLPPDGPLIFAANHQSHLDAPVILAALPRRLRSRLAPAMSREFFDAHFNPEKHSRTEWLTSSLNYYLAVLCFNAFPLPQKQAGTRLALRYMGTLVSNGYSILIFPEGVRTRTGQIGNFQAGVGMIASHLDLPVVPIRLDGVDRVLHQDWKMARPGPVRVAFGEPLSLKGDDYSTSAKLIEEAIRGL